MQYTLATLTQALKDEIEDQGAAFAAYIPNMIKGAEDACIVDLDLEIFNETVAGSFTGGNALFVLPPGFLKIKSLLYSTGPRQVAMEERTYEYCVDYSPTGAMGAPLFWAPYDAVQVLISPRPLTDYPTSTRGPKRPNSLTGLTSGTWLSLNCGDLLFKRCLIEAEKFNKADERIAMWKTEYQEELARKHVELRHLRNRDYDLGAAPQPQPQVVQEQ